MSGQRDLLRSCVLPYAVKYAVSPPMPGEKVCGQARRQGHSEENLRAHTLYPNDRGRFITPLRATALACDSYHVQPFSNQRDKPTLQETGMLVP
jgi:hypothetical protein